MVRRARHIAAGIAVTSLAVVAVPGAPARALTQPAAVKGAGSKVTGQAVRSVALQSDGSTVTALVAAAKSQIGRTTSYDPAYVALAYPGGDVPIDRGVCTDVLIRAFRGIGIDLQVQVHQDMLKRFSTYPKYGRSSPDANIDHRRVKNLSTFFTHMGAARPVTQDAADYLPGDIVMWDVGGLDHTGLVVDTLVPGTDRHQVVHNIGDGAQMEDILFAFPVKGHFRYPVAAAPATS